MARPSIDQIFGEIASLLPQDGSEMLYTDFVDLLTANGKSRYSEHLLAAKRAGILKTRILFENGKSNHYISLA